MTDETKTETPKTPTQPQQRTRPIPTVCEADHCNYRFVQGGKIAEIRISAAEDGQPHLLKPAFICWTCYCKAKVQGRIHLYGGAPNSKVSVLARDRANRNMKKLSRMAKRVRKAEARGTAIRS